MVTRAILPPWYYIFELHDDGKRRRAGEYLHRFETKRFAYEFLRRTNGGDPVPATRSTEALSDKALFTERCRDYQLPAVPVLVVVKEGAIVRRDTDGSLLPPIDLFLKRIRGTGGLIQVFDDVTAGQAHPAEDEQSGHDSGKHAVDHLCTIETCQDRRPAGVVHSRPADIHQQGGFLASARNDKTTQQFRHLQSVRRFRQRFFGLHHTDRLR